MENVGKAFTFVFEDEQWLRKVLMGALFFLLSMILIGIPFVYGYMLETVRNVASGETKPLPEWDNLGEKFGKGLIFVIVTFVYALPGVLIYMCAIVGSIVLSPGVSSSSGDTMSALGGVILITGMCFFFLYMFAFSILLPAITLRFAMSGSFGEAFRVREHIQFLRDNLGNYVIMLLLALVASFIGQLGVIACFVGVFATTFYSYLVIAYLLGQLYRASESKIA